MSTTPFRKPAVELVRFVGLMLVPSAAGRAHAAHRALTVVTATIEPVVNSTPPRLHATLAIMELISVPSLPSSTQRMHSDSFSGPKPKGYRQRPGSDGTIRGLRPNDEYIRSLRAQRPNQNVFQSH